MQATLDFSLDTALYVCENACSCKSVQHSYEQLWKQIAVLHWPHHQHSLLQNLSAFFAKADTSLPEFICR